MDSIFRPPYFPSYVQLVRDMQMLGYVEDPYKAAATLLDMALSSDHSLQQVGHIWWTKVTVPFYDKDPKGVPRCPEGAAGEEKTTFYFRELRPYGYMHVYRFHAVGYVHDMDTRSFEVDGTGKLYVMSSSHATGNRSSHKVR